MESDRHTETLKRYNFRFWNGLLWIVVDLLLIVKQLLHTTMHNKSVLVEFGL